MKIFIFHIGTPTPIFETELELIRKHEKSGDTVRVLQCTGNLPNCHWNLKHINGYCAKCRSRFKNGLSLLNCGENVELKTFPKNNLTSFGTTNDFESVDAIKHYKYDNENIGFGVASSLISICRDHRFDTYKYRRDVSRVIRTAVQVYETVKQEFKEFKPDRVYIFNGRICTHLPAILLCKQMGLDYFVYEVATQLNHYTLRKNATVHDAQAASREFEMTWAKGGIDRDKFSKTWFELKREGATKGNMRSFTQKQVKGILPDGFNSDKKNIAIFNKTIDEYAAISGWENPLYSPDETAGIGRIVEAFESDNRFMFYLRVHPHMLEVPRTTSQLRDIQELSSRFDNLSVIWPEEIVDSYALMLACEKTITFGSTIGLETVYWRKPSILAGRAYFENFDCFYKPTTHEELVKLIEEDLKPLPADSVLKYGFNQMSGGIPFEYFKQTGKTTGFFDGVEIKADTHTRIWGKLVEFFLRVKRVVLKPSVIKNRLFDKQTT